MSPLVSITDPQDPRIAPYCSIRERDLVGRDKLFIAEGAFVVRLLASPKSRFRVRSMLIDERRVDSMHDAIAALPPQIPAYSAARAVMDAIVGFPIHRGILALGERAEPPSADALLSSLFAHTPDQPRLVVALEGLTNHDNVGGIFRNAAAFGVDAVLMDEATCDPLYRKAIRVSVGGAFLVPFASAPSSTDLLDTLSAHGFTCVALTPRASAGTLTHVARALGPRVAVFAGCEEPGLSDAVILRATPARIPMAAGFDSLNVSVATAIALHAIVEARVEARVERAAS